MTHVSNYSGTLTILCPSAYWSGIRKIHQHTTFHKMPNPLRLKGPTTISPLTRYFKWSRRFGVEPENGTRIEARIEHVVNEVLTNYLIIEHPLLRRAEEKSYQKRFWLSPIGYRVQYVLSLYFYITAWAYLKGVSSFTSLHYLCRSLGPFSLPCTQKWP